ncbi:MAG: response regulator [Planctomycetota bacterium]
MSAWAGFDRVAIRFLEENEPPKMILLDMTMPRCDGQEFLRHVRKVGAWDPIHVFVVSGKTPSELGLSPQDGYTHWFHKPLDPRLIVEELAQIEQPGASVA